MRKLFVKIVASLMISSILITCSSCLSKKGDYDYSWVENTKYIAHACGEINGLVYTNSKEALEQNYEKGYRVFEVDIMQTPERKLICWHGWYDPVVFDLIPEDYQCTDVSYDDFMNMEITGGLHTMDFDQLLEFMADHPDMYVVTDTKSIYDDLNQQLFSEIVEEGEKVAPEVLDRIIPQIYYEGMLDIINECYPWKSIIYTLYLVPEGTTFDSIIKFARRRGIRVITTTPEGGLTDWFLEDLNKYDIYVYLHTFNDEAETEQWIDKGVEGFYTDSLI